jgi:alpha-amylase/alpha-mannosidase (GH57 family)
MRHTAIALSSLILLNMLVMLPVSATTPEDIVVDGDLGEWAGDTLMGSEGTVSLHMTWNQTHLAFAWDGTDLAASDGADLFFYLNTSEGGSPLSKNWNLAQTLPFSADYAFVVEDSSYESVIVFNGTEWTVGDQSDISIYAGHSTNKITEFSIPWSSLGDPTSFDIVAWGQWQTEGNVWASFPTDNPASANGAETFTEYWHVDDRNVSVAPNTLTSQTNEGGVEKLSNALNLALVFHQHQPYYKNKLTNMIEMPWVRVHAMTEYVDSPGILEQYPDTKLTYNLVPSFIEQLVEYHEDGTADVHTDFARRAWPVDGDGMVTGYPNATDLELHTMQFQSFWNSGWIYNVSSSDTELGWLYQSSSRYTEIYDMTKHNLKPDTIMDDTLLSPQDLLDLQVLWYLYQFSPDYVRGEYSAIEDPTSDGRPAHYNASLETLYTQNGNYTPADLKLVLDVQLAQMANVLPMYSALAQKGQVELTTTPYYHPIMPLLMMDGWTFEDGIRVNKQSWPEDVQAQLTNGMDLFEDELGFRPTGMWPSEQSVSPAMVQPVVDVGIDWMVTDEVNLAESTLADGSFIDTSVASNLAIPWNVTGADGDKVAVIFRDRVISDRIAFQYGSMTPVAAVSDFIAYIDDVRQQLLDEGKDPSEHLLTVALDGENWMFMSEFQHHDGARPFMHEWYSRLGSHPSIVTTTPGEFLEKGLTLPEIKTIGTGSWIDGTLSTWAGEEEETLGWQRLIEARQALVAFEADNPQHTGLEAAWESLYIAEGSDWYWWYGLDQDSGYDELWDTLFKVHLSNIYKAVGLELPPYLQELWTNPASPLEPYAGVIEPMIDGIALPGEWQGAAKYEASVDGGNLNLDAFYIGYDASNIYLRVDMPNPEQIETLSSTQSPDLAIYFMEPNAHNFNEVQTNFRTYYGNEILGFPAKNMISFNFDQLWEDGQSKWDLFEAKGKVGDAESWVLSGSSALGGCAADEVYEFVIPWSELGLAPRYSTRVKVVSSWADSLSYGDGVEMEMAPAAPAEVVLPDLEDWVVLLEAADTIGDANGDGDYTPPLAADFATASGNTLDLWDITSLKVSQSAWNARFEIGIAEMTDYWSLANGFSHQIVQIYVDQGNTTYGRTDMLEGANAEIADDWAWEVVISGTGEPGAVKALQADSGSTSSKGIELSGDISTSTITFTISKSVIGSDVSTYRYIIVIGSQDGFGPGKWRDVDAEAKTWRMGGGANPSEIDGIDYDPNILDIMLDNTSDQAAMLSSYSVSGQSYAKLTGIEMPEVAQQIYGAKVVSTTATTAIFEWSTTQPSQGYITCDEIRGDEELATAGGFSHSIQVTGLSAGTDYSCSLIISELEPVFLNLSTTTKIDTTAPEILNTNVEVLTDNRIKVSWYTSEMTDEKVEIYANISAQTPHTTLLGQTFATAKNHEISTEMVFDAGTWWLRVISADSSANTNQSALIEFVVPELEVDDNNVTTPDTNEDDDIDSNDKDKVANDDAKGASELLSNPMIQIVLMLVAILVIIALIRSRRGTLDYSFDEEFASNPDGEERDEVDELLDSIDV